MVKRKGLGLTGIRALCEVELKHGPKSGLGIKYQSEGAIGSRFCQVRHNCLFNGVKNQQNGYRTTIGAKNWPGCAHSKVHNGPVW